MRNHTKLRGGEGGQKREGKVFSKKYTPLVNTVRGNTEPILKGLPLLNAESNHP